jgi:antitoxin CptB
METTETRLKRMRMRSWRRGTKEMDLVLGPYADAHLTEMTVPDLNTFDALLEENDQDLMAWLLGQDAPPKALAPLLVRIAAFAEARRSTGN